MLARTELIFGTGSKSHTQAGTDLTVQPKLTWNPILLRQPPEFLDCMPVPAGLSRVYKINRPLLYRI